MSKNSTGKSSRSNRRTFLKSSGLMTAAVIGSAALPKMPAAAATTAAGESPRREAMPTRNLGKTGYKVGIFSLGGQASLERPHNEDIAVPIIEKRTRPWRELHRHVVDLRRPRALERAIRRQSDEASPRRSFPCDEDERAHARWLDADARDVAASSCRPITSTCGNCTTSAR